MTEFPEQPDLDTAPSDEQEDAASEMPVDALSELVEAATDEPPSEQLPPEAVPETNPQPVPWDEPVIHDSVSEPAPPKKRNKKLIWTIVWVVAGLLVACAVTGFFVARPYVVGSKVLPVPSFLAGDRIIVGFVSRGGDDLYLLKDGQDKNEGTLLAEDVQPPSASFASIQDIYVEPFGRYGGFVPGLNWLVLWYGDGERTVVSQMRVGDESLTPVLTSKGDQLTGGVFLDRQEILLSESREGRSRCYMARPGASAERIARADLCTPSLDGSTLYLREAYSNETMLSAVRVKGGKEVILLDDVPDVISFQSTIDGTSIAYVQDLAEGQRLYRVDQGSGEVVAVSDEVPQVVDYGFAPGSDVLFYVIQEVPPDGEMQLYLSTGAREIATGEELSARFTPDGQYLAFLVTRDGAQSLSATALSEDATTAVVLEDSGLLAFEAIPTSPPQLLIASLEEGVVTAYTAGLDGSNLQTIYQGRDVTLQEVLYVAGEAPLYVIAGAEGGGQSLYAAGNAERAPILLLEDWSAIQVVNRSLRGGQLAVIGQPEATDPVALYSLAVQEGATPMLLDDEQYSFGPVVFTGNGKQLLYTAYVGDGPDEMDVCRVPVEGGPVEVLYEKAFLVDVRWDALVPFWSWGQ
jgi:hypothetical protein